VSSISATHGGYYLYSSATSRSDGYEDPRGQVRKDHLCYRLLRLNIFVQMLSLLSSDLELLSLNFDTQNGYSEVRRSVSSDSSR
jgi:hypothetical protein